MDMKKMLAALDGVESAEGTASSVAQKGSMKSLLESLDSVAAEEVVAEDKDSVKKSALELLVDIAKTSKQYKGEITDDQIHYLGSLVHDFDMAGIETEKYSEIEKLFRTASATKKADMTMIQPAYAQAKELDEDTNEAYSAGDENEEGMVSNCCGAPIMDVYKGHGRCSDCKEMASAEIDESVEETEEVVAEEELEEAIMVSAEGGEAAELLAILQNAGMAAPAMPAMPEPEMEMQDEYSNSPDEVEMDLDAVIASGDDMHREKNQFAAAADGDNPMKAFEGKFQSILDELLAEDSNVTEEEDTFVGINTKTGDFESGLSYKEVTSGRFTHMLPDDTTYFDPDTAEELVGAPDEEMEAMGWEKVMSSKSTDSTKTFKTPYGKVDANWDSNAGEFGDFDAEDKQLRDIMMNMADDFGSVDHDNVKAFVQAAMKKRKGMNEAEVEEAVAVNESAEFSDMKHFMKRLNG